MSNPTFHYQKPPLNVDQQIELLKSRGMIISDRTFAKRFLSNVSYYRFSGYAIEFQVNNNANYRHHYQTGVTFDQTVECYQFDRTQRLIVIDALEQIEIAVRTVIINEMSLKHGAHWYMNRGLFLNKYRHDEFINTIYHETANQKKEGSMRHKKGEPFIRHYYENYKVPELPPCWMVAELLSFGTLSMLFANLINRDDQKMISQNFDISYIVMTSWLHSLTYLRNLCAHHSRLWNRDFTLTPIIAKNYAPYLTQNKKFSAQAAVIQIFLKKIGLKNYWATNLIDLLEKHPSINKTKMGFIPSWYQNDFWSQANSNSPSPSALWL